MYDMVPNEPSVISPSSNPTVRGRPASKLAWRSWVMPAELAWLRMDGCPSGSGWTLLSPVLSKGISKGVMRFPAHVAAGLATGTVPRVPMTHSMGVAKK